MVEDLDSTNGTFVNDQRLSGSRQLQAGDRVRLGNTVLEVRAPAPAVEPAEAVMPEVAVTRQRQIPTLPVLVFVAGQNAGNEITVGVPVVLGRDPGVADVVLDKDDEISRRHASFTPSGAGLTVADLGSTNGTFVNGQRATGAVPLGAGDRVEVGETVIEIRLPPEMVVEPPAPAPAPPGEPALPPNSIEVEGLVRQFGDHRAVDGIDLVVNPGEIYGFLGPNGAGKSTTVHMLVTLLPPSCGQGPRGRLRRRHAGCGGARLDRRGAPGGGARSVSERLGAHGPPDGPPGRSQVRAQAAREGAARARGADRCRGPPRRRVLGRDEAPPRPGPGARTQAAGAVPRRADNRPRSTESHGAVGGGRASCQGGGHDRLLDDAIPGGGRHHGRPGGDHRPRRDSGRGHAGRFEGGDRTTDGRGDPRERLGLGRDQQGAGALRGALQRGPQGGGRPSRSRCGQPGRDRPRARRRGSEGGEPRAPCSDPRRCLPGEDGPLPRRGRRGARAGGARRAEQLQVSVPGVPRPAASE